MILSQLFISAWIIFFDIFYYSLQDTCWVWPHLEYCVQSWSPYLAKGIDILQRRVKNVLWTKSSDHPFYMLNDLPSTEIIIKMTFFFSNTVINRWNSLPDHLVSTPTVATLKQRLDDYWNITVYGQSQTPTTMSNSANVAVTYSCNHFYLLHTHQQVFRFTSPLTSQCAISVLDTALIFITYRSWDKEHFR